MELTHQLLKLRLGEPFVSRKGSVTTIRQVVVRLGWKGWTGTGTAVCAAEYGASPAAVRAALDVAAGLVAGASPFSPEQLLDGLETALPGQAAAVSAVDMALHDLLGRVAGLPLRSLLGLAGTPPGPTGLSLGSLPGPELVERARQRSRWPILKLKMTPDSDFRVVGRVREVYPGRIWIDGNGSWDATRALRAAETFHRYGVELLEQPVRAGTPEILRFVRERSPVPVVADEDCAGPADVPRLQGCADVINVKLLKCGGLRRALQMIRLARRLGLRVMLGCKTESVVGITATAQLAGLADYLDLDGHLDLLNDPYVGISVEDGRITLPEEPGIGARPRAATACRTAPPQIPECP